MSKIRDSLVLKPRLNDDSNEYNKDMLKTCIESSSSSFQRKRIRFVEIQTLPSFSSTQHLCKTVRFNIFHIKRMCKHSQEHFIDSFP